MELYLLLIVFFAGLILIFFIGWLIGKLIGLDKYLDRMGKNADEETPTETEIDSTH
ncbi:MAG: hypothetical protein WCH34_14860 [Bacteroidota bacterium]